MCGFVGDLLIRNGSHLPDHLWIQTLEAIHHRGPDSTGTYKDETVRFGFKRLSIIDLEHGDQPLAYSKGRYHIVFNGEIYNYIELRSQLIQRGYKFRNRFLIPKYSSLFMQQMAKMRLNNYGKCMRLRFGTSIKRNCFVRVTVLALSRFTI